MDRLIQSLHITVAATPVRERKDWRPPRKIVVFERFSRPQSELDALAAAAPMARIAVVHSVKAAVAATADADVLIGLTSHPGICEPQILDHAKQLRWILSLSDGVERCMAVPSVHGRNLLVTNMRGAGSTAIAEHAIALTLALARGLDTFAVDQARHRWNRADAARTGIQVLAGKTMLVVGLGRIGTKIARIAHALGMKVTATRATSRRGPKFVSYVGLPDEMLTLAKSADVIVNSAPLTPETRGLFNAGFFAALKPTAFFVNIARGGSVVTPDLVAALKAGQLAGAGLDVVNPEPLPPANPLWSAPNVIITPHVATWSDVRNDDRWALAVENVRRYAAGGRMLSVVNLARGY